MISTLYICSFASMLAGGVCAYFHGIHTRDGNKVWERLAEFGRNALIQMSAMLFALATALYVFENQNSSKVVEQAKAEKSVAYSAIAIRAGLIESKVRSFAVSSRIDIPLPNCLYDDEKRRNKPEKRPLTDISDECKTAITQEARRASQRYGEFRSRLDDVAEALNVKGDWIKYSYFSQNLDKKILRKFLNLQAILNFRDAEAMRIISQFQDVKLEQYSIDKILFDIERYNRAIDRFSKTSIIYLFMYYISFGDIDASSETIDQRQNKLIEDVRVNFELYDNASVNQFINTLSLRSQDCEFQNFKCYELLGGFK